MKRSITATVIQATTSLDANFRKLGAFLDDLSTIRERLNDLHGRQDCEIGNIHNLLNGLKDVLGIGAAPRDCGGKEPAPLMGLEALTERLMKQHAERDILLAELAGLIIRRKG